MNFSFDSHTGNFVLETLDESLETVDFDNEIKLGIDSLRLRGILLVKQYGSIWAYPDTNIHKEINIQEDWITKEDKSFLTKHRDTILKLIE